MESRVQEPVKTRKQKIELAKEEFVTVKECSREIAERKILCIAILREFWLEVVIN
jgi:hypothetical protein